MRRELAIYTEKDELLHRVWIEESEVADYTASIRAEGFRVVDVELAGQFQSADLDLKPNPTDRIGQVLSRLRNPPR